MQVEHKTGWREDNIQIKEQKFNVQLIRNYIHPHRGNTFHYILSLTLLQHSYIPNVLVRPVALSHKIAQKLKEIKRKPLNHL